MPIYEYQCEACGEIIEEWQKFSDPPLTTCKHCQGKLTKLISHSAFHLKGGGWYVTDYGSSKPNSSSVSKEAKESPADKATKSEGSGAATGSDS